MSRILPRLANRFDAIRLALASLVIVSHVPELADGNRGREILTNIFQTLSFGEVAVDGFFLISGYLILQSWLREPNLLRFMQKRVLRIYPAFIIASLVCIFIVGPIAGSPLYWHALNLPQASLAMLLLLKPAVPPVFQGMAYPMVNGAMWTVHYEFACYLLVALMGYALRRHLDLAWLLLTALLSLLYLYVQSSAGFLHWRLHTPGTVVLWPPLRFGMLFTTGGALYLLRARFPGTRTLRLLAFLALLAGMQHAQTAEWSFALFAGFLLTSWGRNSNGDFHFPDVSYGLYLYAWPIIMLLLMVFPKGPILAVGISAWALSVCVGWLSWQFFEKPALRLKSIQFGRGVSRVIW